jgi:hypothetical protein
MSLKAKFFINLITRNDMTNKVITPVGRASFPNLMKPKLNEMSGKSEYSVDILFDKKTDLTKLKELLEKTIKEKWGTKVPKVLNNPIKDGDGTKKNGEPYGPEYHGCFFITVKNTRKPGVVDSQNQDILTEEEIYGGCFIRASVNAFAYDRSGNRGVSLSLNNVQKVKDGEAFGAARVSAADEFDVIDDEADNPDNYQSSNLLG